MNGNQDQETRLQAVLDWLSKGRITTDQAAARVARMHFTDSRPQDNYHMAEDLAGDGDVPEPGSAFAISDAFAQGRINREQYAALAKAAASATQPVSGA